MPRHARIAISGIHWHIIQRGNNRNACFYADEDYRRYVDTMQALADRYGCSIHAYVLTTNHVHLLLTPKRGVGYAMDSNPRRNILIWFDKFAGVRNIVPNGSGMDVRPWVLSEAGRAELRTILNPRGGARRASPRDGASNPTLSAKLKTALLLSIHLVGHR
ncbi:MAG: transposase [Gammaproteobacteria bacterium]